MNDFNKAFTEDRRLVILRLLADAPGFSANGSIIHTAIGPFGHRVSRDQVRTDLAWLEEQSLIKVEVVGDDLHVAALTPRGLDIAQGGATMPGVKRPSPGA